MSLANFSFPLATPSPFLFMSNVPHQTPVNNLRFNAALPPTHFHEERHFQNQPYIPPPPPPSSSQQHQQQQQHHHQRQNHHHYQPQQFHQQNQNQQQQGRKTNHQYYQEQPFRPPNNEEDEPPFIPPPEDSRFNDYGQQDFRRNQHNPSDFSNESPRVANQNAPSIVDHSEPEINQHGYTQVNPHAKTSTHAILDYDDDTNDSDDDYYDENIPPDARVTPIQGPIFLKNGSVPVVPLYPYSQFNNGTFLQIPILWTALSVALGVELRGDLIRGAPCIKKYHQLFCPTAGKTYPIERIELFIDENKALMKRMYGDFEMDKDQKSSSSRRRKRKVEDLDLPDGGPSLKGRKGGVEGGDSFFKVRNPRQTLPHNKNGTGRVDACESKVEIVTPYWASNSAGKIRAIVNTQHFEQAIHQEVCSKTQTNRCKNDCGCEQKYKWHRLLAYDPDNDCQGIFMDWFLFPSCCVCRCDPHPHSNKFQGTSSSPPVMKNRNG